MNNIMEYKGYVGSVEFSEKDGLFFGKVQGIRSLISYEGTNASELVSDFHGAVDDYLTDGLPSMQSCINRVLTVLSRRQLKKSYLLYGTELLPT